MILVDFIGHLVSTESEEELHKFAEEKLSMKQSHYRSPCTVLKYSHYYMSSLVMINKARELGAEYVTPQDLVRRAWWRKEARV